MSSFNQEVWELFLASKGTPPTNEIVTIKNKETGTEFRGALVQYSEDYDPRDGSGVITIDIKDENMNIDCGAASWEIISRG